MPGEKEDNTLMMPALARDLVSGTKAKRTILRSPAQILAMPLLILLAWECLCRSGWLPGALVPTPGQVLAAALEMAASGRLFSHLAASLALFGLGFGLAVAIALPLGALLGWNEFLRRHVMPLFRILAPVPPPAWAPLVIIFFGVSLWMQVFLVFLGVFFPLLFSVCQGIGETDRRYLASARVFGASELTLITHVHAPHALGALLSGLRIGSAMGLVMLVVAELYGGHDGIGRLLLESKEYFRIDRMVVCMFILGGIGGVVSGLIGALEKRLALWRMDGKRHD